MRKLSLLVLSIVGLLALSSCDKGDLGPVMSSAPGSPSFTAPEAGSSYVLTESAAADTVMTMEWTVPDYGFAAAVNYNVQLGVPGDNFANPIKLGTVNKPQFSITVGDLNNRLLANGFAPNQESSAEFRVVASVSDSLDPMISEPLSLAFTPYEVVVNYPEIYVPGNYQAASGYTSDWSPDVAPALTSLKSDDKYEGYVYMANGSNEFKFTEDRTWDYAWGDVDGDGTLDQQDNNNITLADAGYYKINVDMSTLTYTTLNTTWGLIGSATPNGWDSDQNMTYDPDAKVWTITLDLTAGTDADKIKFRANDGWDLNYGDTGADGYLDAGGDDITVPEAGNYTVTLDLSGPRYTYTLTKN